MPAFIRLTNAARFRFAALAFAATLLIHAAWPAFGQTQPASGPASEPATQAAPGQKPLTFEDIYGPNAVDFDGLYATGMTWLPDGEHFLHRRDDVLQRVHALTDAATPAYDHQVLEATLKAHGDFDGRAARHLARHPGAFSVDRSAVLITHKQRLYLYRFADHKLMRLTPDAEDRQVVTLSPQARYVSFVRDNDIYAVDTKTGKQRQRTRDGDKTHLNGILDWVYQEEVYGRGDWRAHWWRDDDRYMAYLQLDETKVPMYTLVDQTALHPELQQTNYPKAGDPNPAVRLGILGPERGKTVWVDLSPYRNIDILIVRVSWAPDGKLIYQVQDREQRWLHLNEAEPQTGRSRTLVGETSPAWVDVLGEPDWLADGSFLWLSGRDGWPHLYHYARDGRLIRRVTGGDWEVRDLHGVDPAREWVYFSGTRDGAIESHAYRLQLSGGPVERLTEPGFSHRVEFNPQFTLFLDTFSNITTPPKVYLRNGDGTAARVISENEVAVLAEYRLSTPEFLRVPARDGRLLNAMLIRPPDLEADHKYPVWSSVYAGPHAPIVHNAWSGSSYMTAQMLAQKGYLLWECDPRAASGEGAVSAWQGYRRLGVTELADLEDGIRWLSDQGYADPQRVGINGWSYGGFMTAYALTHSQVFSLGIAVAPLADWHNYDTIYTERYMQTPQNNPRGYRETSVNEAASNLHGKLLLIHGALDDNVHFQSTLQVIHQLQQAGKNFDLMVYPHDGHGIGHGFRHLLELRLNYIYNNL